MIYHILNTLLNIFLIIRLDFTCQCIYLFIFSVPEEGINKIPKRVAPHVLDLLIKKAVFIKKFVIAYC